MLARARTDNTVPLTGSPGRAEISDKDFNETFTERWRSRFFVPGDERAAFPFDKNRPRRYPLDGRSKEKHREMNEGGTLWNF